MTRLLLPLVVALLVAGASVHAQTAAATTPTISEAAKSAKTFPALLAKYEGVATNLGKLVRVTDAYIILEQEGVETAVATAAVASFQFIREVNEEEGTTKVFLEVQLLSRD
jgi:hypothetical protein